MKLKSVNRVFNGLAVIQVSLFSTIIASLSSALETSSWFKLLQQIYNSLRFVLKGSSSVTYRSISLKLYPCYYKLLKKSCLGVYSGIFAIYLQCPSDESRARSANIVFYILCILYSFGAASVVGDLLADIFAVSNNLICKDIILIISYAVPFFRCNRASTSNWVTGHI